MRAFCASVSTSSLVHLSGFLLLLLFLLLFGLATNFVITSQLKHFLL